MPNEMNARILSCEVCCDGGGVIGAGVIDNYHFDVFEFLCCHTMHALKKVFTVVEGGDNDGELRHTDPLLSGARLHVSSSLMRIRQYAKPVVV